MGSYKEVFFIVVLLFSIAYAWDSEQLEVFDVVEEVKTNFYELLNITQVSLNKQCGDKEFLL